MELGVKVKILRKSLGLTQKDLAKMCGYKSLTTINKIELGINKVPINVVKKLANALNTTPAYLLGWEEPQISQEEQKLINLIKDMNEEEVKELSSFVDYIISKRK